MAIVTILVYDQQTHRPIPYMGVTVDTTIGSTDANGQVRFNVNPGAHDIMVRSSMYRPFTQKALQITKDSTFKVEVQRALVI